MSGKRVKAKGKKKTMSEAQITEAAAIETLKTRRDGTGILRIDRNADGQTVLIYIKHPLLAEIVRKMTNGNAPAGDYAAIYKPILSLIPGYAERSYSKPAVAKITKNFAAAADWSWEVPRAVLIYNADKLEEGYTLTYKVDVPFDPSVARKWGKMFMDGCSDIIANARPFQMTWVMKEKAVTDQEPGLLSTEPGALF